ncbi:MAG: ABC transporter ATP-binding protein [Candidatus Bathyarchaeia archaeon]|nr:ABC transporter ATP-binding protein [Candidatus Bathyarchaeota archaeon]
MTLLEAEHVKAYYSIRNSYVKAVDDVSLSVDRGAILGLAGESGCGKSTLVNTLMMNIRPPLRLIDGTIVLDGIKISEMSRSKLKKDVWGILVSIVPQSALNALMPTKKIVDFVKDIFHYHTDMSRAEIVSMVRKRFEELNLSPEILHLYPHELSGGMKQRVVIAISTLLNPKLLIVDEPTSALDVSTQKQVIKLLVDLHRAKIIESMVFVTHDLAILRQIADKIAIMYAGKIVEVASTDDILYTPLHPYTRGLVNAVMTPESEVRKRGITFIAGEPPNLLNPPSGCRFHPRCPYAKPICKEVEPPIIEVRDDRIVACHLVESFM